LAVFADVVPASWRSHYRHITRGIVIEDSLALIHRRIEPLNADILRLSRNSARFMRIQTAIHRAYCNPDFRAFRLDCKATPSMLMAFPANVPA
jgi:uncharacterized protein YPO0396